MNIYLLLVPIEIILGLLCAGSKGRKYYIVFVTLILTSLIGLRSETKVFFEGSDVTQYYEMFKNIADSTWDELWMLLIISLGTSGDVGFALMQKVISVFTSSFYTYSFIASGLFLIPFGVFMYKYSTNIRQVIFGYLFFTAMSFVYLMAGARQYFAVGLVLMSYLCFIKGKTVKTLILILLASTIHFSSIIFLLPILMSIFIRRAMTLKLLHLMSLFLVPIVYTSANSLIVFMGNFIGSEKYAEYGSGEMAGGANMFILTIFLLSLLCYVAINRKILEGDTFVRKLYCMLPCFTFIAPLINANGTMIRLSEYFHLYLVLLVPISVELLFTRNSQNIVYIFLIGFLSLIAMSSGNTYYFFWQ